MDEFERVETEELDDGRSVQLEFLRNWPKYVVRWSIRRRSGDSDFPVAGGEVNSMPPKGDETVEDIWQRLRAQAVEQASAASPAESSAEDADKPSLLSRIFGRS